MLEKSIESRLCEKVGGVLHGRAIKLISPGLNGVPDRLLLLPGGRCVFAELKAPGKKPTRLQRQVHDRLRNLGFEVIIVDSPAGVDSLVERLKRGGV